MKLPRLSAVSLVLTILWSFAYSQTNKVFISYVGGFQVNLPASTQGFDGMGSGMRQTWRQPEAEYEIGFHERQGLPLAIINGEFSYDETVKRYFNKYSSEGEKVHVKAVALAGNPGFEYKFKTRNSIFLLRLFLVGDRVYQLQAQIPLAKESNEQAVLRVFDSLRLVGKDVVEAHFAKQIIDATPKSLPQSPKVPKPKSDLEDRNIKGKVRSIKYDFAKYALNDSLKQKYTTLYEEFDSEGNLIKAIEHDSHGSPSKVTVFGYISGKRVARIGGIEQEGQIRSGIAIEFPSGTKFDERFDEFYTYQYSQGMLSEKRNYWSNGALYSRATYRIVDNTKVTEYFDGGTRAFRKIVAVLDRNGNEVKLTDFEPKGRKWIEQQPFDLTYDSFDKEGNWLQRSTSRFYGMDGKGKRFPEHVEYRTITYYQ